MPTQEVIMSSKSESLPRSAPDIEQRIRADTQSGVIASWWQLAVGMSETSCTTAYGVAQDTRTEIRRRVDSLLNFGEDMSTSAFGFARRLVDRVDRITNEGLGRSEAAILVVTRTLRKTGQGVADLASTAIADTIGPSSGTRGSDGGMKTAAA